MRSPAVLGEALKEIPGLFSRLFQEHSLCRGSGAGGPATQGTALRYS
jgi:hypothetical protein